MHDCKDFAGVEQLLLHRVRRSVGPAPRSASLGVATPVTGDVVRMTNLAWTFSIASLSQATGLERVLVINDFEALARGLPTLSSSQVRLLGGKSAALDGTLAVLGPGTGLGMAGLVWHGQWVPVVGEGGHASLAAEGDLEDRVLREMRSRFGHVSAERALSGPGLVHLHEALCLISGADSERLAPTDVTRRALDGSSVNCATAVSMFLGWLGAVAGDLALTLGARGGVYVGGGIVPQLMPLLPDSAFRTRFEAKGRFSGYLADIPTWLITGASDAALQGAASALDVESRSV